GCLFVPWWQFAVRAAAAQFAGSVPMSELGMTFTATEPIRILRGPAVQRRRVLEPGRFDSAPVTYRAGRHRPDLFGRVWALLCVDRHLVGALEREGDLLDLFEDLPGRAQRLGRGVDCPGDDRGHERTNPACGC